MSTPTILFAPTSLLAGAVSPYLAKLNVRSLASSGSAVADLGALNSLGGIAGTFLTGFVLFGFMGVRDVMAVLAIGTLVVSWWARGGRSRRETLLTAAALVLLYIFYLLRVRYLTAHMQDLMHERLAERARIARGLHDTLLQSVQGLIMYFDSQARRLPSDSEERAKLEQTLDLADQLMVEGREHIMDLRSEAIPDQLEQALQQYGRVLLHEHFSMRVLGKPRVLCDAVRNEVHAIAREALLNAARHAKASMVVLELDYQREYFIVRVSDNGQGLPGHIVEAGQREGH